MSRTLLVALHEYRQYAATRAFRISLFMIPLMFALIGAVRAVMGQPDGVAFTIFDRSGRYGAAIEHQIELQYQQQVMGQLSAYAGRLDIALPPLTDRRAGRPFSRDEAQAFVGAGGLDAALKTLAPRLPPGAKPFTPPARRFFAVAPPPGVGADASPEVFATAIRAHMTGKVETPVGGRPLVLAVYVPERPGEAIRFWTNGGANLGAVNELIDLIRAEATHAMRLQALRASGLADAEATRLDAIEAPIQVIEPPRGEGAGWLIIRSIIPVAIAYLLLLATLISGNMMLQGMIEERSNRLLETLLSSVSPRELMGGKLLGIGAVGLTLVGAWAAFVFVGLQFLPPGWSNAAQPALESLGSFWAAAALLIYFLTGYLAITMLFLAVGAMSDSLQDAQGYLMPIMMLINLPILLLISTTFQNPDGILPRVLSWIPPYTPFAMLMRLGTGLPVSEILGTSSLLILFLAAEFVLLGRVFRASLLRTGQPPKLGALMQMMFARDQR